MLKEDASDLQKHSKKVKELAQELSHTRNSKIALHIVQEMRKESGLMREAAEKLRNVRYYNKGWQDCLEYLENKND